MLMQISGNEIVLRSDPITITRLPVAGSTVNVIPFLAAFKCFLINFEWINFNPFISTLFSPRVKWQIIYRGTTDNRTFYRQP